MGPPDQLFAECLLRFIARRYRDCIELGMPSLSEPLVDGLVTQMVLISAIRVGDDDARTTAARLVLERDQQIRSMRPASIVEDWQRRMVGLILGLETPSACLAYTRLDDQTSELHYLWGATLLALNDRAGAAHHFDVCLDLAYGPYFLLARTDKMTLAGRQDPIGAALDILIFKREDRPEAESFDKNEVRVDLRNTWNLMIETLSTSDAYRHDEFVGRTKSLLDDAVEISTQGNFSRALELLSSANASFEDVQGTFPVLRTEVQLAMALTLARTGRRREASELYEKNLADLLAIFGPRHRRSVVAKAEILALRKMTGEEAPGGA